MVPPSLYLSITQEAIGKLRNNRPQSGLWTEHQQLLQVPILRLPDQGRSFFQGCSNMILVAMTKENYGCIRTMNLKNVGLNEMS